MKSGVSDSLSDDVIDYSRLDRLICDGLANDYACAAPFSHVMIDDFLRQDVAKAAAVEAAAAEIPVDPNFYGSFEKFKLSDSDSFGPTISRVTNELNSPTFLSRLERITGIGALRPDATLEGGGIHRIGAGGFLKVHTDFNFHRQSGEYRRLNLLIYLNPGWKSEWGGRLELWQPDMSACKACYEPQFNRAVLFTTTDESYHGHPDPLSTPPGVYRHSLAYYYYTQEPPAKHSPFGKSEMTNYRPRPGERFDSRYAFHQFMIRIPAVRPITNLLKKLFGK